MISKAQVARKQTFSSVYNNCSQSTQEMTYLEYLFILFIEIHHKQHINYRSQEFKILEIKLLWRGKKDRHLQLHLFNDKSK